MEFPAKIDHLGEMLNYIRQALFGEDISEATRYKIELVCEEALVNIISYAYPQLENNTIDIECSKKGDSFYEITLIDHGIPFNPLEHVEIIDTGAPLSARRIGGLGIFLLSKLSSELKYRRDDGKNIFTIGLGNVVKL